MYDIYPCIIFGQYKFLLSNNWTTGRPVVYSTNHARMFIKTVLRYSGVLTEDSTTNKYNNNLKTTGF